MANVLMTWAGLWNMASANAGLTSEQGLNTSTNALAQLSKAEHELQVYTNAVRHTLALTIDPVATPSGNYTADLDIKQMLTAQFLPAGAVNAIDVKPIPFEEMDQRRNGEFPIGQYTSTWDPSAGFAGQFIGPPGQYSAGMYYSFDQGNIMVYPITGVSGVLTLKYIPHLIPYDPSNPVGRWSTYTGSPWNTMKVTGPSREFGTAIPAMADYLTMYLIESQDGGVKRYEERYKRSLARWEEAKRFNVKDTVQMNKRHQFLSRNGVVK